MDNTDKDRKLTSLRVAGPRCVMIYELPVGLLVEFWCEDKILKTTKYEYIQKELLDSMVSSYLKGIHED